ncbi:hypothetical protein ACN27E_18645 [Mycobacterium sp. WMMD1722]|uniref:hypothetical protein n=1 Tax=Mycobacterium sp. WMMD1722 TaxID=3404117 RepID=UPI003BF4FCBD
MSSPEPTQDAGPADDQAGQQIPPASPGYSTPPPEGIRDAEDQGAAAPDQP